MRSIPIISIALRKLQVQRPTHSKYLSPQKNPASHYVSSLLDLHTFYFFQDSLPHDNPHVVAPSYDPAQTMCSFFEEQEELLFPQTPSLLKASQFHLYRKYFLTWVIKDSNLSK